MKARSKLCWNLTDEEENGETREEEGWDEDAAVLDEALEQRLVRVAKIRESALETTLEPDERIA